jgi:hypothetical protein
MSATLSPHCRAALPLAKRNYLVLVLAERSKIPPKGSHGLDDATADPEKLKQFFAANPRGNIGIACAASRVVCLDVDHHREEADGNATLAALEAELGALPETVETLTGTGGRHLYFAAPAGVEFRGSLGAGLDIRHNAYCVCPPSIHPDTNEEYRWIRSPLDRMPAELPAAWLARMVKPAAPVATVPAAFKPCTAGGTPWGNKGRADELETLRTAPVTTRNRMANKVAFNLAQLHAGGELPDCREEIFAACIANGLVADPGDGESKTRNSIESGWRAGLLEPRSAPPRPDRPTPATTKPAPASTVASAAATQTAPEIVIPPRISDAAIELWSQPLPPALATPFAPLNDLLGDGLRGLNELAAPTGKGKTSFAFELGRHAGAIVPVLYVSTELGCRQAIARIAGQILKQPWRQLWEGETVTGQAIAAVTASLNFRCIEFRDTAETLAIANAIADREGKAPFLILDYLQGASRDPSVDRRLAVSATSDAALQWCRNTGAVALLVSSVARAMYFNADQKTAGDFVGAAKESGDCEYDAAAVLYVDVDPCPLGGSAAGRIHVAKSRFGAVGTVGVRFHGPSGTFTLDALGSLTADEREVYEAIEEGAETKEAVLAKVKRKVQTVVRLLTTLQSRGLISSRPYRVIEQPAQRGNNAKNASIDVERPGTSGNGFPDAASQTTLTDGRPKVPGPGTRPIGGTKGSPPIGGSGNLSLLTARVVETPDPDGEVIS